MDEGLSKFFVGIESQFDELLENGIIKLDRSIIGYDGHDALLTSLLSEIGESIFKESAKSHLSIINRMGIHANLTPALYDLAVNKYGYKGDILDHYNIARLVRPTNSQERYRAHFDSHLFTLVLPIHIPKPSPGLGGGELIYKPRARSQPRSEVENIFGKIWFKRYANKSGMESRLRHGDASNETFEDGKPLLFIGNTTLHTNRPVQVPDEFRLTLITHFFDPSPSWGIGAIQRRFRER